MCILLFRLLPESPRWLIVKGRNEEANRILHQFAKVNKTAYPADELDITLVKPASIIIDFFLQILPVRCSRQNNCIKLRNHILPFPERR